MSDCIIKSAGIDWITLTTTNWRTKKQMRRIWAVMVDEDRKLGYKPVKGGAYGFFGERAQHGLLAEKDDRMLMQVSSDQAQRCISLVRLGDNCTRLDVQVTVQIAPGAVPRALKEIARCARSSPAIRGKRPAVKDTNGDKGTESVYIGKRQSDVFIRCYDKEEESGEAIYKDCIRLEMELKGKTSRAVWNKLATDGDGTGYLLALLYTYLGRRGVDTSWIPYRRSYVRPIIIEKTKQEVTRAWWATQVAPSVKRDCAEGNWFTPMRILFSEALTEFDFSAIMNAYSIAWGN